MDYHDAFAISAAGMDVERLRIDVATLNLANADSLLGPDGRGYQARRVVVRSEAAAFDRWLDIAVPTASAEPARLQPRRALDAGHPWADAHGFVSHPGIDVTSEMITLMSASRAYEANIVAMNAARSSALKALEIGGAS